MKLYNIASSIDFGYWTASYEDALNQFKKEIINFEDIEIYPEMDFVELVAFDMDDFHDFDFKSDYLDFMQDEAKVIKKCTWKVDEEGMTERVIEKVAE